MSAGCEIPAVITLTLWLAREDAHSFESPFRLLQQQQSDTYDAIKSAHIPLFRWLQFRRCISPLALRSPHTSAQITIIVRHRHLLQAPIPHLPDSNLFKNSGNQPLPKALSPLSPTIGYELQMPFVPRLRNGTVVLLFLSCLWLFLFVYHEHIVPIRSANRCTWTSVGEGTDQTNVLLVADPQLIDNHTYPGRNELLLLLSKHTVDVYLKQNYRALVSHLQPDYIMFLGDYLDNGRLVLKEYYEKEFIRFEKIFNRWSKYERNQRWLTNIPGNHDIGFGNGVKARERFASHFGTPNTVNHINGVDFVFLDALLVSAKEETLNQNANQFLTNLADEEKKLPRVLLSHVPLYRDPSQLKCGPLRESRVFHLGAGYQYQLVLDPLVLLKILDLVKPDLVFSGDDHDYCDVTHPQGAREITVKSISMAMGIKYPAVQVLSYSQTDGKFDYDTHICYLPQPYVDVIAYIVMAVSLGLIILLWNLLQRRYTRSLLSAGQVSGVQLLSGHEPTSQKLSKFLKESDSPPPSFRPLSNYTFTASSRTEKVLMRVSKIRGRLIRFLRRWNLLSFFKHCIILGSAAILLYRMTLWFI